MTDSKELTGETPGHSPPEKTAIPKAMDQAAAYLAQTAAYEPMTPEIERKIVRKLDWILIPMLFLTATLGAVDKVAISTAAIYGLKDDLHLVGQQYSWAGSILSIGAIIGMWPSSYLVQRLPSAKYLASCAFGWSVMALLIAACRNWSGLMALRFFMGCLEAIIVPSVTLIVAGFYKKAEQPPRNAIVLAAVSSVINGFLSWAVGHIPNTAPLAIWQYLYLIVGTISLAWAIVAFIFLPDSPMNAKILTDQEKYYAVQRVAENKTGIVNKQWKQDQALEAIMDPKTWTLFFFNIAINIPNGGMYVSMVDIYLADNSGLTTFSGIIINNLGFSPVTTSLLNMPTGIMSTLSAFGFSWLAARWINRRCLVTMIAACLPIIGSVVVYTLPRTNIAGQMVGIYLLYTYFGPYVVAHDAGISMGQANTAGHTKKNIQYSILYIGYAVGNLIGPQTFRANQAPAYTGGFIAMLVSYCACVGLIAVYWAIVARYNRRLDGLDPETRASTKHVQCTEEQPRCRRCERLNLECQRGLRLVFREDAMQRGISFGRKGRWSKRDTGCNDAVSIPDTVEDFCSVPLDEYIGRWVFLNSSTVDFAKGSLEPYPDVAHGEISLTSIPAQNEDLSLVPTSLGHPLAAYSAVEQYLLNYFIEGIGPSCSLSALDNPYISHITPLAFEDDTLRYALLAVAGNQLRLLGDTRFQRETLLYKNRALTGLQRGIAQGFIDDGPTATILMLCFHDISDECDPSWVTHLQAGLELVYRRPARCVGSETLHRFFTMYFVAHDIMSRTASGAQERQETGSYTWSEMEDIDEIDMVMGCSRHLMVLIDDISNLADTPETLYHQRINNISAALCTLTQTLPAHSSDRTDVAQIAETKRLAALLYLIERAGRRVPPSDCTGSPLEKLNKHHIVAALIKMLSTLPDAATLLWQLYILGNAGLENEEHRRFILDRLHCMQRTRNLGSVRRARKAVKRAFQLRDLDHGGWGIDGVEFISLA
ncbi:fungal-specific transcription factor domain-containing protein [Aspergillus floccosus]